MPYRRTIRPGERLHTTAEYRNREWFPQPAAETALRTVLNDLLAQNAAATGYAARRLGAAGWADRGDGVHANAHALFPEALPGAQAQLWFRVESIGRFAGATGTTATIEGAAHGPLWRVLAFPGVIGVGAIERAGETGFAVPDVPARRIRDARLHLNAFRARRRQFDSVEAELAHSEVLVDAAVGDLGQHRACDLWFRAERDCWMSRCPAGRLQKARQNAAGIGWSNIDHRTSMEAARISATRWAFWRSRAMSSARCSVRGSLRGGGARCLNSPR